MRKVGTGLCTFFLRFVPVLSMYVRMIRIRDIINAPALDGIELISGSGGMDRVVRTVTVLDAPDSPGWLKGSELLLSSAYLFENNDALMLENITQMINAGSSGLGIKMGRFIDNLPTEVEKIVNENDFPILKIPFKFVWTDIISTFYKLSYGLERPHQVIHCNPENVASLVEAIKWNSYRFIDRFTELFGLPAILLSNQGSIISENEVDGIEQMKELIVSSDFLLEYSINEVYERDGYFISANLVPGLHYGKIEYFIYGVTQRERLQDINSLFELVERFCPVENAPSWDEGQHYRHFLLRVISGKISAEEIRSFEKNRALTGHVYSGIILLTGSNYQQIFEQFQENSKRMRSGKSATLPPRLIYNETAAEAVVLVEYHCDKPRANMNTWLNGFVAGVQDDLIMEGGGCIAASNMHTSLEEIFLCMKEAAQACEVGCLLWKYQCKHSYSSLSVYIMLCDSDLRQVDFSDIELLHDPNALSFNGAKAIEAYMECSNYKLAAKRLYIHENTLRYRVQKISEMMNQDFDDPFVHHQILMKIKLWKLHKRRELPV